MKRVFLKMTQNLLPSIILFTSFYKFQKFIVYIELIWNFDENRKLFDELKIFPSDIIKNVFSSRAAKLVNL